MKKLLTLIFLFATIGYAQNVACVQLDGIDDYIDAGTTWTITQNLTVTTWFNHQAGGQFAKEVIVGRGNYVKPFVIRVEDNRIKGRIRTAGGIVDVISTNTITDGIWYFVALIYDYDSSVIRLYVNAQLNMEMAQMGELIFGIEEHLTIGGTASGDCFKGWIDDVWIHAAVLTEAELVERYNSFEPIDVGTGTPTPTSSPSPSVSPTPSPTISPTPTATPTPTITPTPIPSAHLTVTPTPYPSPTLLPTLTPTSTPEPTEDKTYVIIIKKINIDVFKQIIEILGGI